ncbi:MAG: EthD family reductase [Janthinobacterium lividum]
MTILYGVDEDPEAFRRYYDEKHIPLASRMEGLTGWNLSWIDPASSSRYQLVAELYAESAEALDAILASPAGLAASADLDNFVTGTVEFLTGDEEQVLLR